MAKLAPISGFPEWLPEQKLTEDELTRKIRAIFELHGFGPIETPAVELLSTLSSKGVVEREIYTVQRLHSDERAEADLGLHFDLTVPFARYVAQHFSNLVFPFKRYQLQKVWRGERPQKGRFREFYQYDIDIIARDELPLSCDAEVLTVVTKAFQQMNLAPFILYFNNRKLLLGFFHSLGLDEAKSKSAITAVDKILKIGVEGLSNELVGVLGLEADAAARIIDFAGKKFAPERAPSVLSALGIKDPLFEEGAAEIVRLCELLPQVVLEKVQIDLSLARGLDYYTGLIYEVRFPDYPEFGSVSGGGRYDNLASQFINKKLPGVGGTIGFSRLMEFIFDRGLLPRSKRSTADALVAVYEEAQRAACNNLAEQLRSFGLATDVFYKSPKLGRQIDYADSLGMRFVLFIDPQTRAISVKDLVLKQQTPVESVESFVEQVKPLLRGERL